MASEFLSSSLGAFDMMWAHQCREQDMAHRRIENRRRAIDDARRTLDMKVQQLKAISHLSALIAGFSMVVLVEATVPEHLHWVLHASFGLTGAMTVGLMLSAMLNSTLILVLIAKHNCRTFLHEVDSRDESTRTLTPVEIFEQFWSNRCEDDWQLSFNCFTMGVSSFLANLAVMGWLRYSFSVVTSSLITFVAVVSIVVWVTHTKRKWGTTKASMSVPGAQEYDTAMGDDDGTEYEGTPGRREALSSGSRPPDLELGGSGRGGFAADDRSARNYA